MANEKMKSEDTVAQADKQAHTDMAERAGHDGDQAAALNKEQTEQRQKPKRD
jgi:hypothetical protein